MSEFKNLKLDKAKIDAAVRAFAAGREVTGPNDSNPKYTEYRVSCDDGAPEASLHVYPVASVDATTLNYKVGKNQEKSRELAAYVAQFAARPAVEPRELTLKFLQEAEWTTLRDLLAESGLKVVEETMVTGVRMRVTATAHDQVVLNRYSTGRFTMQGRRNNAYEKVLDTLFCLNDAQKSVIDAQLASWDVKDISKDAILAELAERLPTACAALDETSKLILAPAIAFARLEVDLPEYSAFAHPALRGLEACMKHLMSGKGIIAKIQEGMGIFFDKANGQLKANYRAQVVCVQTIGALEEFYGLYARDRHGLFHADGLPASSRILETKAEAVAIINDVFFTVEKGFGCIATGSGYV